MQVCNTTTLRSYWWRLGRKSEVEVGRGRGDCCSSIGALLHVSNDRLLSGKQTSIFVWLKDCGLALKEGSCSRCWKLDFLIGPPPHAIPALSQSRLVQPYAFLKVSFPAQLTAAPFGPLPKPLGHLSTHSLPHRLADIVGPTPHPNSSPSLPAPISTAALPKFT